ncbi:pyrroline-5-carboxylate reductase [Synergistales bacterium]|nr:pyrroline-5-carboxylate reductase [Synergistales bacterium]
MKTVKETKISIIGAGALGGAVAIGLSEAGCRVTAADAHPEKCSRVKAAAVTLTSDNARAATEGEVVFFAVKPHLTLKAVRELAPLLTGKLCVSLAAAVELDMLKKTASEARWARAMTSICAALRCSFTGISKSGDVTDEDTAWLKEMFALLGDVEEVEEKSLDALTALTGAAPAFFLNLLEAAAMGGIQAGLPKDIAYKGATAALLGASRLSQEEMKKTDGTAKSPGEMRDSVCTPGGMTIEGIYELERAGARGAMMRAVLVTAEKGRVLTERVAAQL